MIYLHFWPAGYPLICFAFCSSGCGPYEWWVPSSVAICAAIVSIRIGPWVDQVRASISCATDHCGFGLEVAFGGWGAIVLVGPEEFFEKGLPS